MKFKLTRTSDTFEVDAQIIELSTLEELLKIIDDDTVVLSKKFDEDLKSFYEIEIYDDYRE